jgi:uncharacterized protein YlbG (UPF0298 family)
MEEALEAYLREPVLDTAKALWREIYETYLLPVWVAKDWSNQTINIHELQALERDVLLVYSQFLQRYQKHAMYGSIEWVNYEYAKMMYNEQNVEQSLRTIRAIIAKRIDERERAFAFAQALRLHHSESMERDLMQKILRDGRV